LTGFHCQTCGQHHDELPFAYTSEAPESWFEIPEAERSERAQLSSDQCIIDHRLFFVRGNIEIPVIGSDTTLTWGVWVSLSEKNFHRCAELWNSPGREREPPYFGWLNTVVPGYPVTINLKTHLHTRRVGERPLIELEPNEHPLAIEQRNGIRLDRVREIAESLLHGTRNGPTLID
jgi:hypothetical protein